MAVINSIVTLFSQNRLGKIEHWKRNPYQTQRFVLEQLLAMGCNTEYGKKYKFRSITTAEEFRQKLPVIHYEEIVPQVSRMLEGENAIFWPDPIEWFAKSSGTTDAKSKYIPISIQALEECHFRAGKDVIATINKNYPDTSLFLGKTLALGGSQQVHSTGSNIKHGDLSAILISNSPFWANLMKTPDPSIMLMSEWEEKLERICDITIKQDVRCLAGVPSWFLMLIKRVLQKTGKSNLHEVWPNLEMFIHGGVSFAPYREQYKKLLPNPKMKYMETYNASEGFFALQDDPNDDSMLLMLDYGVYYEFMPLSELGKLNPKTLLLDEVECGVNYALIITTSSGLWRYMIGDTIQFTSLKPHKIKITGRTKLFINAFGEELIIDNAIEGLKHACKECNAEITEYTAAPIFMSNVEKGAHQWLIEFATAPEDLEMFTRELDLKLQQINSDYEAKRYKDMSLKQLEIVVARPSLFIDWLKSKGKLGGQNKVPRLWNDRTHIDQLLDLNQK